MKNLIFVTGNEKKLEEVREFFGDIEREDIKGVPEIQGEPEDIARHKAKESYKILQKPCMVEDVDFGIKDWDYLPGPYIKEFLEKAGVEKLADHFEGYEARAGCTVALALSKDDIRIFRGEVNGKIVRPRKDNGFGFDLIFVPEGYENTFSEMEIELKNKIGHRGKALLKLKSFIEESFK
ncbi:MAG: non-canonical purine NTP pyrophosphatase [Nanobdellota archaeon]